MKLLSGLSFVLLGCAVFTLEKGSADHSSNSEELGVLLVGDQGKGNQGQRIVADALNSFCQSNRCDFAFLLGDNFYNSGVKGLSDPKFKTHFEDLYSKMGIEFWAVLGNHDYGFAFLRGDIQAQIDYTRLSASWRMPSRYYSFQTQGVQFIALDTVALPRDKEQQDWLDRRLEAPHDAFRVVLGHYPIHSSGEHGDTEFLRDKIAPKLCGNTDIYASGHDHDLEHLKSDCGVNLVVSGSGAETRDVVPTARSVFAASKLGFAYLKKTSNKEMTIQYFDSDLQMLSEFKISK